MGTYGQELVVETLGYMLGAITHLCGTLCATSPTSIVGAMLWTGYAGETMLSYLRAGNLPIALISLCLALAAWGAMALRDRGERNAMSG